RGIPLAVDNTFLTPILQQPLELGADITVYSTTKHIEGHSAALGGAITTRDAAIAERLRFIRKATGGIQTPFNAWLTVRGIKTLAIRIREQSRNAAIVAQWLADSDLTSDVIYPGLANFPQQELANRQHLGFHGGVVTFELKGGYEAAVALLSHLKVGTLAEHIGSVETLFTHPASMTHGDVPREHRLAVGLTDGLIRLSVGLEDPTDVIDDIANAAALAGLQSIRCPKPAASAARKETQTCPAVN
ncbi:MAG: PLP-dependent transferase, partial [bacterium]|nr:PLP-dependent transferase [bacterium]